MTDFKVGQRIEHNRFGQGKILEITGNAPDLKAKITFDHYGEKLLLLKYAKMRVCKLNPHIQSRFYRTQLPDTTTAICSRCFRNCVDNCYICKL